MNEKTEKTMKIIEIIENILWIITLAVTLIVVIIMVIKNPKKQASAQEVVYYLEPGIYELSGTPSFVNGGLLEIPGEDAVKKTVVLIPNYRIELTTPEEQYTVITSFMVYQSLKKIDITYNSGGDPTNTNIESEQMSIYDTQTGYFKIQGERTSDNQYIETKIPVESYTMVVKKRYEIRQSLWKWFNENTKKPDSETAQENYQAGYETGYQQGIQDTISNNDGGFDGYQNGYNAGQAQGYQQGYQQAMKEIDTNNPYTFNNLIGAVMRAPSEFFKSFWGTEILGFNLSGLISVMFTMALVFAIFGVIKKFI